MKYLKLVAAWWKNTRVAWSLGYAAGRVRAHSETAAHWADVVESYKQRAHNAERSMASAEAYSAHTAHLLTRESEAVLRLRAILQTRNLAGGFSPNGVDPNG